MESLEKLIAYIAVKPFLKHEDWIKLGKNLNIDPESLKRVWGKEVEDIFFLIALTYKSVEHIIVFNEGFAKLTSAPTPDGLLILKSKRNLLLEVKGTQKEKWAISRGRFDRQVEFAKKLGMELYFAVYHKGYWGLFPATFVETNGYEVRLPRDLEHSEYESIFDSYLIEIPKGLQIVKHYSKVPKGDPLSPYPIEDYGFLTKYEIQFNGVSAVMTGENTLIALSAIEAKFNANFTIKRITENDHVVTHECPENILVYDYEILLTPINQTMSTKTDDLMDSSSFVTHVLDDLNSRGTVALTNFKDEAFSLFQRLTKDGIPLEIKKIKDVEGLRYPGNEEA